MQISLNPLLMIDLLCLFFSFPAIIQKTPFDWFSFQMVFYCVIIAFLFYFFVLFHVSVGFVAVVYISMSHWDLKIQRYPSVVPVVRD